MCAQNGLRGLAMMYLLDYNLTPMECSHVLLETVALGPHEDQTLVGFGRKPEVGDPARCQQQELLADVQNSGDTAGSIQRVVEGAGFAQCENEVSEEANLYSSYAGTKDLWRKAQTYASANAGNTSSSVPTC